LRPLNDGVTARGSTYNSPPVSGNQNRRVVVDDAAVFASCVNDRKGHDGKPVVPRKGQPTWAAGSHAEIVGNHHSPHRGGLLYGDHALFRYRSGWFESRFDTHQRFTGSWIYQVGNVAVALTAVGDRDHRHGDLG